MSEPEVRPKYPHSILERVGESSKGVVANVAAATSRVSKANQMNSSLTSLFELSSDSALLEHDGDHDDVYARIIQDGWCHGAIESVH